MSFRQTWDEITNFTPDQQRALRDALNLLLGDTSTEPQTIFERGWKEALALADQTLPILDDKDHINGAMFTMAGITLKSQTPDREMLSSFSQFMGGWIEKIDRDESAFGEYCKKVGVDTPSDKFIDITPALEFREAFKAYWDGTDPTGMRLKEFAASLHPIFAYSLSTIAPKHYIGSKLEKVIDRLCLQAKHYRDKGYTWEETYDQLEIDVGKPQNPLEQEEYDKLFNNGGDERIWGVDNLKKAYQVRYPIRQHLSSGK